MSPRFNTLSRGIEERVAEYATDRNIFYFVEKNKNFFKNPKFMFRHMPSQGL